ncbi:high affinity methionine permease [Aspergillus nomiae NRRL 13137]|uniref:High affinity methionine permease n=1 Tax=Aspergillus nomiae NRRL (strain ATCC 15546 / NRRL 13137 / CBS 260.88 / M93) TaxID=1509407 RepID=A0A0L1INM7_ASPN3|nr:high affinity methionine permease [Aspergillus nomiae NRRL 13137]KNG81099.1 high affinity methionine permease [Aspergillus nomiae NRRL 13137]
MGLPFWHDREKDAGISIRERNTSQESTIQDGAVKYTAAEGVNSTSVTYQDASGAPVETDSPLGYSVSFWTSLCLNINQMVGTGIFSTPATILKGVGSVGLSMIYWFIGYLLAQSTLAVYLELASYFPSRSGSEVVYLEQAFPKPAYLFPTVFAAKHVIFSFGSSNSIVFAQYVFGIAGSQYTNWQLKGVAVAAYTVATLVVSSSTKWSLRVVVWFGFVKIATLVLISIAGLVVLGGHTKVEDPMINWHDAWKGTSSASAYGATNAMVKIIFSYAGYTNAFSVVNEIKNPIKTLRWSAPFSLILVTSLYILVNVAYFSAASREEILNSKQIAAGIFFKKIFGTNGAARALNVLICISAFGNLMAVMVSFSRMLRETGRQGILPWPRFWTSTRPFGTPLGPYLVQWAMTVIMILAPPAGDAFNFVVDLSVYPTSIFNFLLVTGLLLIRWRRSKLNLPRPEFRSWAIAIGFALLANLYLLAAPWYPPTGGATGGDVSFWYGTYMVVGIGLLAACGVYYYIWITLLPKYKGYEFRQTVLEFDDGSVTHNLVKVPVAELASWDAEHDAVGRLRHRTTYQSSTDVDENKSSEQRNVSQSA